MSSPSLPRLELEDRWRARVSEAHRLYQIAKLNASQAAVQSRDRDLPKADGNFAFQKALREETFALQEFRRALLTFSDLVVHGKLPPDA
jgi:hypothetical protein